MRIQFILFACLGLVLFSCTKSNSGLKKQNIGTLQTGSGTLLAADPMYLGGEGDILKVQGVPKGEFPVDLYIYENGDDKRVFRAEIVFSDKKGGTVKQIGEVPVDSGTASFIDADSFQKYYKTVGQDRIGEIYGKDHEALARSVADRFKLKYKSGGEHSSVLTDPVSEEQEKNILAYMKKTDKYPPFMIKTNNTFDLISIEMDKTYLPTYGYANYILDQATKANMVAFSSGYGDGSYKLNAYYDRNTLVKLELNMTE
jgi:hypothetical protein